MLPVSKGASELRHRTSLQRRHYLGSLDSEISSAELNDVADLPGDVPAVPNVVFTHLPGPAAASHPAAALPRSSPIVYRWNVYAILLTLLYVASAVFYFYVRIRYSMVGGPLFWPRFYSWLSLAVEGVGVSAMLPYALLLCRSHLPAGSPGLPAAAPAAAAGGAGDRRRGSAAALGAPAGAAAAQQYDFRVRVLIPCYKEPVGVLRDTISAAMAAELPPGVRRSVYLCDDGCDAFKEALVDSLGPDVFYITGRVRGDKEMNGKSANVNNVLQNVIYYQYKRGEAEWAWQDIPGSEVVVVFDADMASRPGFFCKVLEVLTDPGIALCLTPQSYHNIPAGADLFNNINLQFWEYWLPGASAWGYIACTGTNFALRASALAHAGWFPEYTITEDYALGMELKAAGYQGCYLADYLAVGEAPDEIRNCFRQRSRWTKGHWQVFLSGRCPLLNWKLPLAHKLWYSYGTWSYAATIITTPFFIAVPFISLALGVHPLTLNTWVAAAVTAYYASIFLLQSYCRNLGHLRSLWFCQISSTVLWFTYTKAVINTTLSQLGFKTVGFKVTEKKVGADGGAGSAGPPGLLGRTLHNVRASFGRMMSNNRYFSFKSAGAASSHHTTRTLELNTLTDTDRAPLRAHDVLAHATADRARATTTTAAAASSSTAASRQQQQQLQRGTAISSVDSLIEKGAGPVTFDPAHCSKADAQKVTFNVHIYNKPADTPSSSEDADSVFARHQQAAAAGDAQALIGAAAAAAAAASPSSPCRGSGKQSERSPVSGLKRVLKVFVPANVGDLGGVLDPLVLVLLLLLSLASVAMGCYKAITALTTPGAAILVSSAYLGLPLCWAISGAVAPYLFVHYCFSGGVSFRRAAAATRGLQGLLVLASLACLWVGLPADVQVAPALQQGINFLQQQTALAATLPDGFLLPPPTTTTAAAAPGGHRRHLLQATGSAAAAAGDSNLHSHRHLLQAAAAAGSTTPNMAGGFFPSGSDPVKYTPGIAYTTAMLSWGLLEFRQGFQGLGPGYESKTLQVIRTGADYLVKALVRADPAAPVYVARLGDPGRYITTGVTPAGAVGPVRSDRQQQAGSGGVANTAAAAGVTRVWGDPADELESAGAVRPALLVTNDSPGVDVLGSSAAALAAAFLALKDSPEAAAAAASYVSTAEFLYSWAKRQVAQVQQQQQQSNLVKPGVNASGQPGLTAGQTHSLTEFDPSVLSYCGRGDCSWTVDVQQPVLLVHKAAGSISCWAPDYSQSTCLPHNTTSACRQAQQAGSIFHRAAACCSALQAAGVWNATTPAGVCAVPEGQGHCYVPISRERTCVIQSIGWQPLEPEPAGTSAAAAAAAPPASGGDEASASLSPAYAWRGCTGRNMDFYGDEAACCHQLWQAQAITPERPGLGLCANPRDTCWVFDTPGGQCTPLSGTTNCTNWEQLSFGSRAACCNELLIKSFGGDDSKLRGSCKATSAAETCWVMDLVNATCVRVAGGTAGAAGAGGAAGAAAGQAGAGLASRVVCGDADTFRTSLECCNKLVATGVERRALSGVCAAPEVLPLVLPGGGGGAAAGGGPTRPGAASATPAAAAGPARPGAAAAGPGAAGGAARPGTGSSSGDGGRRLQQQQQQQHAPATAAAAVGVAAIPAADIQRPGHGRMLHQQQMNLQAAARAAGVAASSSGSSLMRPDTPPSLLEGSGLNFTDDSPSDRLGPAVVIGHSMVVPLREHRFASNSSLDDLAWAAAWLFKATGKRGYLGESQAWLAAHREREAQGSGQLGTRAAYYTPNWANSNWGTELLLSQVTDDPVHHNQVRGLIKLWVEQEQVGRSPQAASALRDQAVRNLQHARQQQEESNVLLQGEHYHVIAGCIPQVNLSSSNMSRLAYKTWEDSCSDGLDDDCDGLTDADDQDCALFPVTYTSPARGLAWTQDEPAPNAAAAAFLALVYSQSNAAVSSSSEGRRLSREQQLSRSEQQKLCCWALGQASFLLGDNPQTQSFIVGNSPKPPAQRGVTRPQHQASSCPDKSQDPSGCDWSSGFFAGLTNPRLQLADGALVAGPDRQGNYHDDRTQPGARVGTHYNAAWLSGLAGLLATGTDVKSCGQLQGVYQQLFDKPHFAQLAY